MYNIYISNSVYNSKAEANASHTLPKGKEYYVNGEKKFDPYPERYYSLYQVNSAQDIINLYFARTYY